jgi:hypothetical protein
MCVPHCVYPLSVDGPLGCLHLLAIVNNVMKNCIEISVLYSTFNSVGQIPKSGIAG